MAAWRDAGRERRDENGEPQIVVVPPQQQGLRWGRGIITGVAMIGSLILLAIITILVFTGTDWGRERVRRFAQNWLNTQIHGRVTIGKLSGNLLTGMTVHNFAITDSAGEPFVAVESFRGDYSIIGLLKKHIWIDNAVAIRPLVVLDHPPKGKWNWQRIFPTSTTPTPPSKAPGWLDWIRFTNASVVDGQLIVRTPWSPAEGLRPTARDSVIRDALGGGTRLMISRAPGGFQKTVQLDSVTAAIPFLRITEPGKKDRLLEVSSLTMEAFPFRAPGAVIRDLKGVFPFNNDSVWWKGAYAELPHSKASGNGSYNLTSGDLTLQIHAEPASFADMRWIYPRLPTGNGKFDLALKWRGAIQTYQFTNANVSLAQAAGRPAQAQGSFGITLGDTITLHDTNLRFANLDTRTLEQLIPHFKSPRRGTFAGRASVHGGRRALVVDGDVRFDDQRAGPSRIVANGEIGFLDNGGVRARNLRLTLEPVQVAMARTWYPSLPIGGTVTGTATVNGTTNSDLAMTGNLTLADRGTRSTVEGTATVRLAGTKSFNVNITARPVSLVEVGRFMPSVGLQGSAAGPIHVVGTLRNLRLQTDLRLPDGGRFAAHGALDLASAQKGYDITARLYTLNLRTIDAKAPVTSLTAQAAVRGRGTQLATMNTAIAADLSTSRWDNIAVDTVSVRATLASGLANIQKLYAVGAQLTANVSGSFGLTRARSGELTYTLASDSLGALNRWIPLQPNAPKTVAPRPGVMAHAIARARADSARLDRATEMQRMIHGDAPGPKLVVHAPKPVPTDTVSGTAYAAGTLRGNIYDFDLRGRAGGENVVVRGNFVRRFRAEYAWIDARSPASKLAVGLDADSASVMGFAFDTVSARLTYASSSGHVEVAVTQDNDRHYGAVGDYTLKTNANELRIANMTFQFDTAFWHTPHPASIQWGGPGIRVNDFELVNRGNGRLYADGLLPTSGMADFRLDVDNFPVSNIADIVQTDIAASGILTLHGTMTGTLSRPAFRGAFGLVNATYNKTPVPNLRGTFAYADELLVTHAEEVRPGGPAMAVADARLPLNLAITGVTGSRILPGPASVDVVADSLPLDLVSQFTDYVAQTHGYAVGKVSLRGTLKKPVIVGGLTVNKGAGMLNLTGAQFSDVGATVRLANDTVYVDSVAGQARGSVRLRGTIAIANLSDPVFNLYLVSSGARLVNNNWANVLIDAGLALTGPYSQPYVSGAVTITQGVVYAPEPTGRHLIGAGDPELFNVLDTSLVTEQNLFPVPSPFMTNLRMEVSLNVHRDTWVRNREANVEVYTDDPLSIVDVDQSFQLTGVVTTDRGEYDFLGKRFQIQRGSAMFIGTPDINPTLQITGEYTVEIAARGALDIRVLIGGTLKKPKLSLESDAQPPKTQSELLSLLAFGQSTTSLVATSASSITGSAATMDLFGVGAQMAVRRLATVAVGVMVEQVQIQASRGLGTDVFAITPGDVPVQPLSGNAFRDFIFGTKVEAGKYINPRTYVGAQTQAARFGLSIDHRTADGWRFTASWEPRVLLGEPTLDLTRVNAFPKQSFGGFVIRDWRF